MNIYNQSAQAYKKIIISDVQATFPCKCPESEEMGFGLIRNTCKYVEIQIYLGK